MAGHSYPREVPRCLYNRAKYAVCRDGYIYRHHREPGTQFYLYAFARDLTLRDEPFLSAMKLSNLAHVCIRVSDIVRTVDFYNGLLGLPIKLTFVSNGSLRGACFQVGLSTFIEAIQTAEREPAHPSTGHFCLETTDIDGCIAELRAKGVSCTDKKLGFSKTWTVWLTDPDGHIVEINEYTPESAQLCGGAVVVDW